MIFTVDLKHFCYFGQLANKRPYDRFFINLALNLALKIHQKSTQEAPKINKKSIKNNVQDMIPFFIDFSRFWRPLGPQVGPMLRPCWPQNLQKSDFENNTKKTPKTEGPGKSRIRSWGPLIIQKTTLSRLQEDKARPRS